MYSNKDPPSANSEKKKPLKGIKFIKKPKKPARRQANQSRVAKKKPNANKPLASKIKANLINKSGIHSSQKKRMLDHASTYSKKHIGFMIGKLENGAKFNEAHLLSMKSVGK